MKRIRLELSEYEENHSLNQASVLSSGEEKFEPLSGRKKAKTLMLLLSEVEL